MRSSEIRFYVDILKDMLKDDNLIGFLAIDAKDTGWGLLHGDRIQVLSETGFSIFIFFISFSSLVYEF